MTLIILVCVIQMVWGEEWGYYHKLSVETFQPPVTLREDSYFGFSITYDQYNKRLMISAPRESNIGEVYECDLSKITDKSCLKLATNMTREADWYKHDYWFGATIKAGPSFVMACTPRYSSYNKECDDAGMYGRCYIRKENETYFSSYMSPVRIKPEIGYYNGEKYCVKSEKNFDTLGWSLDIGEDRSVIVGGPAMFQNTGIAAIRPPGKNFLKRIDKREENIYNFGYSVAVGYFISEKRLSYAVSTTYGSVGVGKVYFYTYSNEKFNAYITLNKNVDENIVGTMFGAVLCTAKINVLGKGNDLLVGAPTFAFDSGYDIGAVYVYVYDQEGIAPKFRRKIVGSKYGSWFGSAIISVGDLNGDGQDEIAIGAPFEDAGAVYLYSGASICATDKPLTFLQKITPSEKNLASFGYSLTAIKDYDENGCNEMAISAPFKDRVMLYKCLAAVTVTNLYAVFPDIKNRTKLRQSEYIFQVCMDLQYPEKTKSIIAELSTDVKMDHQYARLKNPTFQNVYTFKTSLQSKRTTYCQNVEFVLPLEKDYTAPIEYTLTTKLQNNVLEQKNLTAAHIILSDNSKLSYSGLLSAGECSGAGECISNLSLTVSSDMTELPIIIGSQDKGAFHINVLNTGDVAYDPCVQFTISGGNVLTPPMYCSSREERWLCTSMKPIWTNESWVIKNIVVDLRDLTNQDRNVTLNLKLFDRCADTNNSKPYEHIIPLKSYTDGIYVIGTTDIGDVHIVEDEILFSKHFKQIYTIVNKGPTSFKNLIGIVKLQKTEFITYSDAPVSIYMEGISPTQRSTKIDNECKVDTNNDLEIIARCQIHSLFKDNYVRIVISLETNPDNLTYEILKEKENVEVHSLLSIHFDKDTSKSFSLSTLIYLQEAFINRWMLIAAGLVGLLLIIIIAFVLYKSGFLQRKNKKKLQYLKQDIKRQTIRRSMISQSRTETETNLMEMEQSNNDCSPLGISK